MAAVVLYLVAVGNVRGFAFTLGLTALIDVILVFLFTHPMMQLLAQRTFFATGRRFSGLSAKVIGCGRALPRGRPRFARRGIRTDQPAGIDPAQLHPAAADRAAEVSDISEQEWAQMTPSPNGAKHAASQPAAASSRMTQTHR